MNLFESSQSKISVIERTLHSGEHVTKERLANVFIHADRQLFQIDLVTAAKDLNPSTMMRQQGVHAGHGWRGVLDATQGRNDWKSFVEELDRTDYIIIIIIIIILKKIQLNTNQ